MKFSRKFMTDMNVMIGPVSWGDYFSEMSLDWFHKVHGENELSYQECIDSIKTDPTMPEDQRIPGIKSVKMLQSNPIAIKYGDRYERLNEYRIITPKFQKDFADLNLAIDALKIEMSLFYSTNLNDGYFQYAKITETADGVVMSSLSSFDDILPNELIRVHSRSGKINTVSMSKLSRYLNSVIKTDKLADSWEIHQKIQDIDDGFTVFEKIVL